MSDIKTSVSLYSLQYEYLTKRMSLKDILKYMHDLHVDGVEVLPDQMIHGAPEPSEETLKNWHDWIKEYNLDLSCIDVFLNTDLYKNRTLTLKEDIKLMKKEIDDANKLGYKTVRMISMTPPEVVPYVLPYAEKLGITLTLELHAGLSWGVPATEKYLKMMKEIDSPYLGITVDTGIFCRRIPRVMSEYWKKVTGVSQETIDWCNSFFDRGEDVARYGFNPTSEFKAGEKKYGKTPADKMYITYAQGYENKPLSIMDDYLKYIKHFHFKLYEMTDKGEEYSINYHEIMDYLHEKGYKGYVSTEYEGNRFVLPGHPMIEKEQVKAHVEMMRKEIARVEAK
ncbi:sugar phosphate isomerase/epimerase family protein [Limosilactobacillus difficilis]|uniref:sugar phosphate isomerase/epimerase family protein n=1 Tax=Limosilactobacillus difficilis TaxID=2991838 RepID=UPI0024B9DE5A|nr:TIM barrel protein [Limosilactobacillus difficilis]